MTDEQFDQGLAMRKRVMGEDFVARAYAGVTDFTAPMRSTSRAMPGAMCGSARGWT